MMGNGAPPEAPSFDRCVLFLADRWLHRSLPPRGPGVQKHRWLLTAWLDGTRVDAPLPLWLSAGTHVLYCFVVLVFV